MSTLEAVRSSVPPYMGRALSEVAKHPDMGEAVRALESRGDVAPLTAALAGAAMIPSARAHVNAALDARWAKQRVPRRVQDEVVIGGGLHAAIYCAARVAEGGPPPLVLEGSDRVGGAMALGESCGFYLNSRNRPGNLAYPGFGGALNVLPGAPIQPSDISAFEYQRSTDLAYVVRATLAMYARVCTGARVEGVLEVFDQRTARTVWQLELSDGTRVRARRVVRATGLGDPLYRSTGRTLVDFAGLIRRMDEPFPLRGLSRVAVVGAGDSGKTAIEALAGQGPGTGWSPASLDAVRRVDWYGVPTDRRTCETWVATNRSRYKAIGALFPSPSRPGLVRPRDSASTVSSGYSMGFVDDRPYDLVVDCRGFMVQPLALGEANYYASGGRYLGYRYGRDAYGVGPCGRLPLTPAEQADYGSTPESETALFRYADRTAALAAALRAV